MNNKIFLIIFVLIGVATGVSAQRRTGTPPSTAQPPATPTSAKPQTARLMVQGTYEETFQGTTNDGNADGHLVVKFEAARWLRMETNEAGNAEFSELEDAPAADVSGSVSYQGHVKGPGSGGDSYNAENSFSSTLGEDDIVLTIPEYTDTGDSLTMSVFIQPTLKGKCSTSVVRSGKTTTSNVCDKGTFFITTTSPLEIEDNDDPEKTADKPNLASFETELVVEPDVKATSDTSGDAGVHAWRGAVTTGSKEAGFKITLTKTKDLPSTDKRGKITRKLTFTATIIPGAPK